MRPNGVSGPVCVSRSLCSFLSISWSVSSLPPAHVVQRARSFRLTPDPAGVSLRDPEKHSPLVTSRLRLPEREANMQRPLVCVFVGTLLSLALSATPVLAQGALSEVNGTAADQSGAVLPGVAITLTEETTGLVRTVITNDAGRWVVPALQPGRYAIKAELSGFQTQTRAGVVVNVGQAITINLALPVGGLTDQVTVTGEAPLVEVTRSDVGANITAQQIDNLPTAGRQQYALLALVPGLTPTLAAGS